MDRVAEILGGAIEWLMHGRGPGCELRAHSSAAWRTNPYFGDKESASGLTPSGLPAVIAARKRARPNPLAISARAAPTSGAEAARPGCAKASRAQWQWRRQHATQSF